MTTRETITKLGGTGYHSENVSPGVWAAGCTMCRELVATGATREQAESALIRRAHDRSLEIQFSGT